MTNHVNNGNITNNGNNTNNVERKKKSTLAITITIGLTLFLQSCIFNIEVKTNNFTFSGKYEPQLPKLVKTVFDPISDLFSR